MLYKSLLQLGQYIKKLRHQSGLSMDDIGGSTKLGQSGISRIEAGTINITVGTLDKLARANGKRLYILIK